MIMPPALSVLPHIYVGLLIGIMISPSAVVRPSDYTAPVWNALLIAGSRVRKSKRGEEERSPLSENVRTYSPIFWVYMAHFMLAANNCYSPPPPKIS